MIELPLKKIAGDADVLASRLAGLAILPDIEALVRRGRDGDLVVVDAVGIHTLTPSYYMAALYPLWSDWRDSGSERYPILVNVAPTILDDLQYVFRAIGASVWVGICREGQLHDFRVAGPLDDISRQTLDAVCALKQATAGDLQREYADAQIGRTGWNNRLTPLYEQRLLRRRKQGKEFIYMASWATEAASGGRDG